MWQAREWEKRVESFGGKAEGKRPLRRPRRRWHGDWLGGCEVDSPGCGEGPVTDRCEHG
jgi:hypothetical protein